MSKVIKFGRRPRPPPGGMRSRKRRFSFGRLLGGPLIAVGVAVVAFAVAGLTVANRAPSSAPGATLQAAAMTFSMCGRERFTCVVDGDTIWLEGQNLRLASYDTPEPHDGICGGAAEVALANKASARLLQLLNGNAITVETFGLDGTGKRTLATVRIAGRDVGDILIAEKLARRWPDGEEWWCQ